MRKLLTLLAGLLMLVPSVGWAQQNTNTLPPECAMTSLVAGSCVPLRQGVRARASGASATDCETAGAAVPTCEYDGSNWIPTLPGTFGDNLVNPSAGNLSYEGDLTVAPDDDQTFAGVNQMLQTIDATGFALHNQFVGIPKLNVTHIAAVGDGTGTVAVALPNTGANCSAIVNGAEADDLTTFITGNSSYEYTWAANVATDDGIDCVIAFPAQDDVTSFGMWFRTDTVITAGDIDINFDDGGVEECTVATLAVDADNLDVWLWIEVDITDECAGKGDGTDGVEFLATAQGAAAGVLDDAVMNVDNIAMWLLATEEAIGNILVGGMIDFSYGLITPAAAGAQTQGVEWTSHFINYQTGADAIIPITDLSLSYGTTLEALE